jgi:hypothetical protein
MRVRIKQEETMKKSVRPLLGALIIILAAGPFAAPQTRTPGAFVEVAAAPKLALAGQPVVISGKTGYHEKKDIATVKINTSQESRPSRCCQSVQRQRVQCHLSD